MLTYGPRLWSQRHTGVFSIRGLLFPPLVDTEAVAQQLVELLSTEAQKLIEVRKLACARGAHPNLT